MGFNLEEELIKEEMKHKSGTRIKWRPDLKVFKEIDIPKNYFKNDDPELAPIVTWRAHAQLLYTNWLNYYVYQTTPFDVNEIK